MPNKEDIALMAHLMRRAGFGATRGEQERLLEQGYQETVEQLLHPEQQPEIDEDTLYRYLPMAEIPWREDHCQLDWLYRMVNTMRPLQEKMAFFWHHVFATANSKVEGPLDLAEQIRMFRRYGMGSYKDLLVQLGKNPAMIFWLDNCENHKRAPNENWGRELLELFSMGIGNYTEKDVFECARAFTGWTNAGRIPSVPSGHHAWEFEYRPEDHDYTEKTFLGHTGRFNGEDIIDIIVRQPACARFISRHLYNFFVADEVPVPSWATEPPGDPEAIDILSQVFVSSGNEIVPVLRTLFNADFFKEAMYRRIKSPVEVVVGTLRLTGDLLSPDPRWPRLMSEPTNMGQDLLDPPSVEGWHTGREWINSGALINRVNFAAGRVGDTELPGVQDIIKRVASNGSAMTAEKLVDSCLDLIGPLNVKAHTHKELVEYAEAGGPIKWAADEEYAGFSRRVANVLALIAGTREYQFC